MQKIIILVLFFYSFCSAQDSWIFKDSSLAYQNPVFGVELQNKDVLTLMSRPIIKEGEYIVPIDFIVLDQQGKLKETIHHEVDSLPLIFLYSIKLYQDHFIAFGSAYINEVDVAFVMAYFDFEYKLKKIETIPLPKGLKIPEYVRVSDMPNDRFILCARILDEMRDESNYMVMVDHDANLINDFSIAPKNSLLWQFFYRSKTNDIVACSYSNYVFDSLMNFKSKLDLDPSVSIINGSGLLYLKRISENLVFTANTVSVGLSLLTNIRYGLFDLYTLREKKNILFDLGLSETTAKGNSIALDKNKNIYLSGNVFYSYGFAPDTVDVFLMKLDSNANQLWKFRFNPLHHNINTCVTTCDDGGVIWFGGGYELNDPQNPDREVFIMKLDKNGKLISETKDHSEPIYSVIEKTVDRTLVLQTNDLPEHSIFNLVDIQGKIICRKAISAHSENIIIETAMIPSGVYAYTIESESKMIIRGKWRK